MSAGLRKRTWEIVEGARPGDKAGSVFVVGILSLIFLNVVAVIAASVQSVEDRFAGLLNAFEVFSVAVFTAEYAARLWSCTADPRFQKAVSGRVRLALRPMSLIDLAAILPFFLPFVGADLRSLRVLRLMRLARIAKAGRYSKSLALIKQVIAASREELAITTALMGMLLVVSSSLLYYAENPVQPDSFSSIPATMWWAIATLSTVGYGDMFPVTGLGKCFAGLTAILGVGMFALPTGILGAGFVEAVQKSKAGAQKCPHCGKELP